MHRIERLGKRQQEIADKMDSILDLAKKENRDLSEAEAATFDALEAEDKFVASELEEAKREEQRMLNRATGRPIDGSPSPSIGGGFTYKNLSTGETLRAFAPRERLHSGAPVHVGNYLAAMLSGRLDQLSEAEMLAATGGSQTSGGYLLNPALSGTVIDLARAASVCFRAGAQTLPMPTGELSIARVASDATSYWRGETVAVTASSPTFERITLRAKTLACLVPVSIELLEDSANAGEVIQQTLQRSMAAELDRVIIAGSGAAGEPTGITNATGTNATGSVGTPTDWSKASGAIGDILTANYPGEISNLSWLQHPALGEVYDNLAETDTGAPLRPTPWVEKLQRFYTTNMPVASANYTDVIGDFSQVLVGMRTSGMVVQVLDSGTATDGDSKSWNAATQLMKFIRVYLRADVALLQPSWFSVLSGITLSG